MKYKIIVNIINHHLDKDELEEAFKTANEHKDTPYREDYSQLGGGYAEINLELTQVGRNLKLEIVYTGEGKTFEEKSTKMKNMVVSGELQRSLLYECIADISNPAAKKKADKITTTIHQIG